jgi:hypothetical protein
LPLLGKNPASLNDCVQTDEQQSRRESETRFIQEAVQNGEHLRRARAQPIPALFGSRQTGVRLR